ncbi:MAG: transporter [Gammaproteobacteria bacterium]|nr:transporter [Gammaproteobacteria bacterium]
MQNFIYFRAYPVLTLAVFCGVMPPTLAAATPGETSVILGAEYTSGDYGTSSKTKMWYFPVTLRHETDRYMLSLTVPYVVVDGSGNVVAGGSMGGMPRMTTSPARRTESGLGDIEVAGSHVIAQTVSGWRVGLGGLIKFGTADEQDNLGTGEDDFSVQLEADNTIGNNMFFGTAGYKVLGDPPGIDYEDVFYGSVGISHRLDATRAAGVEWYGQESPFPGADGKSELTLFLSGKLEPKTQLTGYLMAGFADGSPDWGAGVTLKLSR